jgi:hypothetical protein
MWSINTRVYIFIGGISGARRNMASCVTMWLQLCFGGGGSLITPHSVLSVVLGHTRHWILSHMWQHWVWSVLLKTSIHEGQLERLSMIEQLLTQFCSTHDKFPHILHGVFTFQSKTQIMTEFQANQQMWKMPFCIIVNIPKISYLASLVMQKVNKRILFLFDLQTLLVQIILSGSHHAQASSWKLCLWSSDHVNVWLSTLMLVYVHCAACPVILDTSFDWPPL